MTATRATGNSLTRQKWEWLVESLTTPHEGCIIWPFNVRVGSGKLPTMIYQDKEMRVTEIAIRISGRAPTAYRYTIKRVGDTCSKQTCVNPRHLIVENRHRDSTRNQTYSDRQRTAIREYKGDLTNAELAYAFGVDLRVVKQARCYKRRP